MKKNRFLVFALGSAFAAAVYKKMQKPTMNSDSIKGKVKEVAGDWTDSSDLKAEGTVEQVIGASKEVINDIKDTVSSVADSVFGSGSADKFEGKVKEAAGKLTGDKSTEFEGAVNKATGHAKDFVDEAKNKVEETVDDWTK